MSKCEPLNSLRMVGLPKRACTWCLYALAEMQAAKFVTAGKAVQGFGKLLSILPTPGPIEVVKCMQQLMDLHELVMSANHRAIMHRLFEHHWTRNLATSIAGDVVAKTIAGVGDAMQVVILTAVHQC
jgi:hypothetical protein